MVVRVDQEIRFPNGAQTKQVIHFPIDDFLSCYLKDFQAKKQNKNSTYMELYIKTTSLFDIYL